MDEFKEKPPKPVWKPVWEKWEKDEGPRLVGDWDPLIEGFIGWMVMYGVIGLVCLIAMALHL